VGIVHLIPVLASLLFGNFCAFLILTSQVGFYQITPFSEGVGSFGNALYFVILVGVGASVLYMLLKRKNMKIIDLVIGFALTTTFFMLSIVYLTIGFSIFTIPNAELWALGLSLFITVLGNFAIFGGNKIICNVVVLMLGGALGTFLGASIPTLSTVLILGFLAVYDTFAVYYGPVGKITHQGLEHLKGLSFSFKDAQMGLGDLTFYSMLSGHLLLNFGLASSLASLLGILLGCFLAFRMLEKKRMFPGLPFPIFLGLATGFLIAMI
jgi:presenilin-like A22 family membrane protease